MRQIVSSGSVKAFWVNNKDVINTLKIVAVQAKQKFPEIIEIWLFGSFAKGEATGISDIDIFIVAQTKIDNPLERIKPYYNYFSDCLKIAVDIIVAKPDEKKYHEEMLNDAILLAYMIIS